MNCWWDQPAKVAFAVRHEDKQVLRKPVVKLLLVLVIIVVVMTIFFGLAKTKQYSAYAACRQLAMTTKGYAAWNYKHTYSIVFLSQIVFSDGYNELVCDATGIRPFWRVRTSTHTLVACMKSLEPAAMCPEDYFGVNP